MDIHITLLTTAILGILYFFHSMRVIQGRMETKTNLGDGGNELMLRRIRIHGNFAEYVPFLLLILFFLEVSGAPEAVCIGFSVALIVGRVLHFYGLYSATTPLWARVAGMQLTLWPLLLGSCYLAYSVFTQS